ncbi:hypothetical protein [Streptomyces sp. CBMA123]|uniref:hypothetical protein n=1 Tax=Streptomyces sp. CBMA123 TaxID=1896313 RepID=UPI001661B5D1|nr:hypothetical protein [Streptomyces sp. CBMA123]MBD0692465.1 hypothetical protein [Streptomyces sp. CBMA123]
MIAFTRPPSHVLGGAWLAGVSSNPGQIRGMWRCGQPAPIQVSCRFDVVAIVGAALTRAVVDELRASEHAIGPVLYDHGVHVSSWLVPVRPDLDWQMSSTTLLTAPADGSEPPLVAMPAPGVGRVGVLEWLVEPDGTGMLTRHSDLAVALHRVRAVVRRSSPRGRRRDLSSDVRQRGPRPPKPQADDSNNQARRAR